MNYRKVLENLLSFDMSKELKNRINDALGDPYRSEKDLKAVYEEMRSRRILLRDREDIDWFPQIDQSKCTQCRVCFEMCPKSVFVATEDQILVESPYNCVLLCSGCAKKCPQSAIQFPEKEAFMELIVYR